MRWALVLEIFRRLVLGRLLVLNIFLFIPTWGSDPIWRSYFSKGLKPPTSFGKVGNKTQTCFLVIKMHIYTWKPKHDPCFDSKKPILGGKLTFKNRGHLGSRHTYNVYIYTIYYCIFCMHMLNETWQIAPFWNITPGGQGSHLLQLCHPLTRTASWKRRGTREQRACFGCGKSLLLGGSS